MSEEAFGKSLEFVIFLTVEVILLDTVLLLDFFLSEVDGGWLSAGLLSSCIFVRSMTVPYFAGV